jgi:hypothetical protein
MADAEKKLVPRHHTIATMLVDPRSLDNVPLLMRFRIGAGAEIAQQTNINSPGAIRFERSAPTRIDFGIGSAFLRALTMAISSASVALSAAD